MYSPIFYMHLQRVFQYSRTAGERASCPSVAQNLSVCATLQTPADSSQEVNTESAFFAAKAGAQTPTPGILRPETRFTNGATPTGTAKA